VNEELKLDIITAFNHVRDVVEDEDMSFDDVSESLDKELKNLLKK